MTDHIPQEVIDRLRKLERMASQQGGATEGEMNNALEAIRKLRDRYDIEEGIAFDEPDQAQVVEETAMEWNRLVRWQEQLAWAMADLFDCQWYIQNSFKGYTKAGSPKEYKGIRFYGMPRDVRMCCEVYEYSYRTIRMMMRMAYGGGNWTVQHRSYAEGVISRVRERVRQLKRETEQVAATGAIVLAKDAIVKQYRLSLNLGTAKRGKVTVDRNAQALGYKHGDKLDLTPSDRKVRKRTQAHLGGTPKQLE